MAWNAPLQLGLICILQTEMDVSPSCLNHLRKYKKCGDKEKGWGYYC